MERQDCTTSHYVYLDVHNERIIYNQNGGQYCPLDQLYRDILTSDGKFVRIKLNRSWIEKIFDRLKGRKGNVESVVYSVDGQDRYNLTEKLNKLSLEKKADIQRKKRELVAKYRHGEHKGKSGLKLYPTPNPKVQKALLRYLPGKER